MLDERIESNEINMADLYIDEEGNDKRDEGRKSKFSVDDYDPHLHRRIPNATTNFETLVHLLKGSLGTGILAMPKAFFFAGLLSGVISTVVIGILATYCLHVLVRNQYILCKRKRIPILSYPDSMEYALTEGPNFLRPFAKASNLIVDVFMIVYQLGICCVYIVFVASNVKKICDHYIGELSVEIHTIILLPPLIAINCIKNLKLLAPFSILANLMTFVGLAIIMSYLVTTPYATEEIEHIGTPSHYALYFGTTLFALEAVGVVIALENNMKTPKSFGTSCGVLNVGMIFIVFLYILVGVLGYIKYGANCMDSITLNLPQDDVLAESVPVIFAVAIFISYGLQCYVPVEIIWKTYIVNKLEGSVSTVLWEYALRIVLVLITFVLAISIPRLSLFISLFGALCLSALGIAFPALLELCVRYPNDFGPYKYTLIKDILLIIFGSIGLVAGTYTALYEIVKSFQ